MPSPGTSSVLARGCCKSNIRHFCATPEGVGSVYIQYMGQSPHTSAGMGKWMICAAINWLECSQSIRITFYSVPINNVSLKIAAHNSS